MQKKSGEVDNFLKNFSPIYSIILIYGLDRGAIFQRAQTFSKNIGINLEDPFATIRLDAQDIDKDSNRFLNEVYTIPIFQDKRFIWVKNVQNQKNLLKALKNILKNIPEKCYILLEAGDLKKGTALRTLIETAPNAMALPSYHDEQKDLNTLIEKSCTAFGLSITFEAKEALKSFLGADRMASYSEIEKLCLYAYDKGEIDLEDVKAIIYDTSLTTIDNLVDAVLMGNVKKLIYSFEKETEHNTSFYPLLHSLARQFQQLQSLLQKIQIERFSIQMAFSSAKPLIFYKKQQILQQALNFWDLNFVTRVHEEIYTLTLLSRKHANLEKTIILEKLMLITKTIENKKSLLLNKPHP